MHQCVPGATGHEMRPRYQLRSGVRGFLLWVVRSKAQIFQRALKLFRRGMSRHHDHAVLRCPWIVVGRNFGDRTLKRAKIINSQQAGTTGRDHHNLGMTRKSVTTSHVRASTANVLAVHVYENMETALSVFRLSQPVK